MAVLEGVAMAVDEDVEYYRTFYTNYKHPFGVRDKITKEESEQLETYIIAKKDKEGRVVSIIKMHKGEVFFHFEYTYYKNGKLASMKSN